MIFGSFWQRPTFDGPSSALSASTANRTAAFGGRISSCEENDESSIMNSLPYLSAALKQWGNGCFRKYSCKSMLNPDKAPQLSETISGRSRTIAFGEWELPEDATACQNHDDAMPTLIDSFSKQARPLVARRVWVRTEKGNVGPSAKCEAPASKQFRFIAKLISPAEQKPGFLASLFARITCWSPGARRRPMAQPSAHRAYSHP